jgi:hypothetical protein
MRQTPQSEVTPSPQVDAIVAEFTERLLDAAERATAQFGRELIGDAVAKAAGREESAPARREQRQSEREVAGFTKQLVETIEAYLRAQVKGALAARRREIAAAMAGEARTARAGGASLQETALVKPRRRRQPVRPTPPPLDPEQIKRDAEFARLRAILKPVSDAPVAIAVPPAPVLPPREQPRPTTPGEVLRALEKEIQNAVPTLGRLGPERCGAQIAVWSAQVRELRDRLPPDVAATMRPAFRIFLEHLTQLHAAMEVPVVDALEPTFNAPDWEIYIEANRARLEERPPALPEDKLHVHHRTMLRALILPHRRNANKEAVAIIDAASRVLPPTDPQLQSALRRFASLWKSQGGTVEAPTPETSPPAETASTATPAVPVAEEPPTPAEPASDTAEPPSDSKSAENEFESPWLK